MGVYMKILIANDQHWPMVSGVATAVRTLAQALSAEGHEVLVVAPSQTGRRSHEVDGNYTIVRVLSLKAPFRDNYRIPVTSQHEMRTIIEEFQPDIIHVQTQIVVGLSVLRVGIKLGIPVIAANHAMPENVIMHFKPLKPLSRPIKFLLSRYGLELYRGAELINMPTQSAVNLYENSTVKVPKVAISNGIDLSLYKPGEVPVAFKKKFGLPTDGTPVVAYVGRLDGEKHVDVLLRAIAIVAKKVPVKCLIVGGGAVEEDLHALTKKLKLQDTVIFTGRVSEEDKIMLQRAHDIFAMPSPAELQCLALLEAMASGKPSVAVNVGALSELCQNGKSGYLVEVDNVEMFAKSLEKLLVDKTTRTKFGKESVKIAQRHDIKQVVKDFVAIYTAAIEAPDIQPKKRFFGLLHK